MGIALICLAGYIWLRRRRRQQRQVISPEETYPEDGKPPYTESDSAVPTYEVEGRVYKLAPAELSSNTDAIVELPGHGTETRSDNGMDHGEPRYGAVHEDSDART